MKNIKIIKEVETDGNNKETSKYYLKEEYSSFFKKVPKYKDIYFRTYTSLGSGAHFVDFIRYSFNSQESAQKFKEIITVEGFGDVLYEGHMILNSFWDFNLTFIIEKPRGWPNKRAFHKYLTFQTLDEAKKWVRAQYKTKKIEVL